MVWANRFSNQLPHALDKTLFGPTVGFVYKPDGVDLATGVPYYNIHAGQIDWNVLGTNKATGAPIAMTKVWGYGNGELPAAGLPLPVTFPGRSFEVMRDAPIDVHWYNDLNTPAGNLPHLLPVDQTVALQTDPTGRPSTACRSPSTTTAATRPSSSTAGPTSPLRPSACRSARASTPTTC